MHFQDYRPSNRCTEKVNGTIIDLQFQFNLEISTPYLSKQAFLLRLKKYRIYRGSGLQSKHFSHLAYS